MRIFFVSFLLCATVSQLCAILVTSNDVRMLQRKIKTIQRAIKSINSHITYFGKVRNSWDNTVNKMRRKQQSYVTSAKKSYTKSEKQLKSTADRYLKSFLRKSKYIVEKKMAIILSNESKKTRAEWKKLHSDAKLAIKNIRISVSKIHVKNHYNVKKARMRKIDKLNETIASVKGYKTQHLIETFDHHMHVLANQLQSQQYFAFEKVRTDGFSGIKQIKSTTGKK